MYRTHTLLIAVVTVTALAACGSNSDDAAPDGSAPATASTNVAVDGGSPSTDPEPDSTQVPTTDPAGSVPLTSDWTTSTMPGPTPANDEPLYEAGDIDNGLRPFIDQATADLAARLDVDPNTITTHAAVLVVWPDSSLGCPEPGMSYAQAQVDGSIIELEHGGKFYRYHTGGNRGPFICPDPVTKAPQSPALDANDG